LINKFTWRDEEMMRLEKIIFTLIFIFVLDLYADSFPKIEGWQPSSEVIEYNPGTLWEHINGAADQFINYGFQQLCIKEFKSEEKIISIEIYDMGSSLSAYGIFAIESRNIQPRLKIGAEAVITPPSQCLMFKSRYYVKVYAYEGKLSGEDGRLVLTSIASAIDGTSDFPVEVQLLPTKNRIEGSIAYARQAYLGLAELRNCVFANFKNERSEEFQYFIMVTPVGIFDMEKMLGAKWKKSQSLDLNMWYRQIPEQGLTGIMLTEDKLFGTTNAPDEKTLLKRLNVFVTK
jgi:hypothetical protein